MPSCAILYASITGNTKLACEYITNRIPQVDFDLYDVNDLSGFSPESYTFVGFASYTDYQAPPRSFIDTLRSVGPVKNKEAFILMTYAAIVGKGLKGMKTEVENRGFKVIISHSITMPESYPPQRKRGFKGDDSPKEKELERFKQFIRELGDLIVTKELKGKVEPRKIKIGLFNSLIPYKIRTDKLKGMGKKKVDLNICTRCGICHQNCPYKAITMQDGPIFDENICHACFACYNKCPVGAITSEKITTPEYRYSNPPESLKKRMSY